MLSPFRYPKQIKISEEGGPPISLLVGKSDEHHDKKVIRRPSRSLHKLMASHSLFKVTVDVSLDKFAISQW